ncbi:hypothetical protein MY539_01670 [Haemophilus influenzae]
MTALSIEERLEKLEAQMQMRIERQNLLSELIYQQAKLQSTILYLSKMRESFLYVEPSFSHFLSNSAFYTQNFLLNCLLKINRGVNMYVHYKISLNRNSRH